MKHKQAHALVHMERFCVCWRKVVGWRMCYDANLSSLSSLSLSRSQWEHLCLPPVKVVSWSSIQVVLSLTFLPPTTPTSQPLLITSQSQFPLKRGQICCATECAEGFLGRWALTALMERRRTHRTNWVPLTPLGQPKNVSFQTVNFKVTSSNPHPALWFHNVVSQFQSRQ